MCQYAVYRYRNCFINHNLGHGPRGGRAFRIKPCQINLLANDELKDSAVSRHRIYDHAAPCEGETSVMYYLPASQVCPVCNRRAALAAGYPLNQDYALPDASILTWDIPFNQMKGNDFRSVSYTEPKTGEDEEKPVSPRSVFQEVSYTNPRRNPIEAPLNPKGGPRVISEAESPMRYSGTDERNLSTVSDNSTLSRNELRPPPLQIRPAVVRVAAPTPLESHPGDTFFDNY
jgi:hypothetical protein